MHFARSNNTSIFPCAWPNFKGESTEQTWDKVNYVLDNIRGQLPIPGDTNDVKYKEPLSIQDFNNQILLAL